MDVGLTISVGIVINGLGVGVIVLLGRGNGETVSVGATVVARGVGVDVMV
jgi:hypothetical protein